MWAEGQLLHNLASKNWHCVIENKLDYLQTKSTTENRADNLYIFKTYKCIF